MDVNKPTKKTQSVKKPSVTKKPLNRQTSKRVIEDHQKPKKEVNQDLDRDSAASFPASDSIAKY